MLFGLFFVYVDLGGFVLVCLLFWLIVVFVVTLWLVALFYCWLGWLLIRLFGLHAVVGVLGCGWCFVYSIVVSGGWFLVFWSLRFALVWCIVGSLMGFVRIIVLL